MSYLSNWWSEWSAMWQICLPAKHIAVVSHVRPDFDAYGSLLGAVEVLREAGCQQVTAVLQDALHQRYQFLVQQERIASELPLDADVVIVVDCGDQKRIGDTLAQQLIRPGRKVLCIDHHQSNKERPFGDVAVVDTAAASASELVYAFARYAETQLLNRTLITPLSAQRLLAGIYADTGAYAYSSVSKETFTATLDLVERGASLVEVANRYFGHKSLATVRLHARALLAADFLQGGQIGIVQVTQADLVACGATLEDVEGLAEQVRNIAGVAVSAVLTEDVDYTKVSLRSQAGSIAVSKICEQFGGGGHLYAAGFRSKLPLAQVREQLVAALETALRNHPAQ